MTYITLAVSDFISHRSENKVHFLGCLLDQSFLGGCSQLAPPGPHQTPFLSFFVAGGRVGSRSEREQAEHRTEAGHCL